MLMHAIYLFNLIKGVGQKPPEPTELGFLRPVRPYFFDLERRILPTASSIPVEPKVFSLIFFSPTFILSFSATFVKS